MKKSVMIFLTASFLFSILSFTQILVIPAQSISSTGGTRLTVQPQPTVTATEPSTEADVCFIVHPDGRVVMGGTLSSDSMASGYTGPAVHGTIGFTETNGKTTVTTSFTVAVPPGNTTDFPFNSTTVSASGEFSNGLLNAGVNVTVVLPPEYASQFPFNVTDFTLAEEYSNNQSTGTVTVHVLSGFPLEDITIDYSENLTDARYNGSINVVYGVPYMDLRIDNETQLQGMLDQLNTTLTGQGDGSLYNLTDGLLEATRIDYSITPFTGGATVDFELYLHGDVMQSMAALIQKLLLPSGYPAVTIPPSYYVKSSSAQMAYSRAQKEASIKMASTINVNESIDYLQSVLPNITDPQMAEIFGSLLNTTLCSAESGEFSLSYAEGTGEMAGTVTIGGDLNAELNYIKNVFVNYYATQMPLPWQMLFINETKIDVSNLRISLNLNKVSFGGSVDGLVVMPPMDPINATNFKLERFFNLTADTPFPGQNEKLKVTVEGGSNATHRIRIFRPETVPEPNISALGGMIWNNQSISNLKDLIFQIGPPDNTPPEIGTPTHEPETPNPGEDVTVSVNVTDADTGVRPDGVILSYTTDGGGTWNNVTLRKTTGDTYEGIIQGLPAGAQVNYMIIAYDYENNEAVKDDAGNYYVYIVIPEFPALLYILVTLLVITLSLFAVTMTRTRTIHTTNFFPKTILASL